ncbi:MAG: chorismate mutase [Alphaproteobacteria bacterium CG_4_9_14_3_um_filter_47_13]|nr:MAG: chorismate mutase [Alphaproteobacteria bacterium CG_4_9_14_3_um_filter_47_13]
MSKTLDVLRQQIDILDHNIHDLLMKRGDLVTKIAEEKRKNKIQAVQPAREVMLIRKLLARHKGDIPSEIIVRVWREIVGTLQNKVKVAVCIPYEQTGFVYWDMAKDYFSNVSPLHKVTNPLVALSQVRENEAAFAVLPWPEDDISNPWWGYLLEESGDPGMKIVARLPLGQRVRESRNPEYRALLVARLNYEPTGSDRSFLALDLDEDISRARILERAKTLDLAPLSLHSCSSVKPRRKLHLLEIEGYLDPAGEIQEKLLHSLDDPDGKCICPGGYPVPFIYRNHIEKSSAQ